MSNIRYEIEKYQALLVRDEYGNVSECDYQIDHASRVVRMREGLTDEEVFGVGYRFGRELGESIPVFPEPLD